MDRRVPVVAAEERRRQRARRLHVLIAAQDVRDLAGYSWCTQSRARPANRCAASASERRSGGERERQGGGREQGKHAAS